MTRTFCDKCGAEYNPYEWERGCLKTDEYRLRVLAYGNSKEFRSFDLCAACVKAVIQSMDIPATPTQTEEWATEISDDPQA